MNENFLPSLPTLNHFFSKIPREGLPCTLNRFFSFFNASKELSEFAPVLKYSVFECLPNAYNIRWCEWIQYAWFLAAFLQHSSEDYRLWILNAMLTLAIFKFSIAASRPWVRTWLISHIWWSMLVHSSVCWSFRMPFIWTSLILWRTTDVALRPFRTPLDLVQLSCLPSLVYHLGQVFLEPNWKDLVFSSLFLFVYFR